MEKKFKLGLIVALYLSKYDSSAVERLGYKSRREAFREIGLKLNVNHNTIKHMRDQFDTIFSHRAGYHQSPMPPSRLEVAEKYSTLSESALYEIVIDILNQNNESKNDIELYVNVLSLDEKPENDNGTKREKIEYTTRGITGLKAEDFFREKFKKGEITGFNNYRELIDTRQEGTGYDFKLNGEPEVFFEVKGLIAEKGGILFTDKEWETAKKKQEQYILVFITNINHEPHIQLIKNPYQKFNPRKNINKTITVNWAVDESQL